MKNNIIIKEDHALVELRDKDKEVVGYAKISLNDIAEIKKFTWSRNKTKGYALSMTCHRYMGAATMHKYLFGTREGYRIDHINGDRLDNRRENLRWLTPSQNGMNRLSYNKGVSYSKSNKKWRAYISIDQKLTTLGHYDTEQEALFVREQAVNRVYKVILDEAERIAI